MKKLLLSACLIIGFTCLIPRPSSAQTTHAPPGVSPVEAMVRVVNVGVECQAFEDVHTGQIYTVANTALFDALPGPLVGVYCMRGTTSPISFCQQGVTINVTSVSRGSCNKPN